MKLHRRKFIRIERLCALFITAPVDDLYSERPAGQARIRISENGDGTVMTKGKNGGGGHLPALGDSTGVGVGAEKAAMSRVSSSESRACGPARVLTTCA